MRETDRRWKPLSPEVVVLLIIPTAALATVLALGLLNNHAIGPDFWLSMLYVRFFGSGVFHILAVVGLAYFVFSAAAYVIQRRFHKLKASAQSLPANERFVQRFQVARNFVGIVALYAYAITANVIAMNAIMYRNPDTVAWACDFLMRADRAMFGCFVPFELHTRELFNNLSMPMMFSYLNLTLVLSVVLVALFAFRADRLRQFVLGFVLIMSFSLPGWAAIPAITPSEAYRTIKLPREIPYEIAYEIAGPIINLDDDVTAVLNTVELHQSDPKTGRYYVTSIPSPHVAWGMLVVWFGIALYPRTAYLLVPWGLLNCLGAIYSLEHYAVDAVAGIAVTIVAIYFVRGLVALEAKHGLEAPRGYGLAKFMEEDAVALGRELWPRSWKKAGQAGA